MRGRREGWKSEKWANVACFDILFDVNPPPPTQEETEVRCPLVHSVLIESAKAAAFLEAPFLQETSKAFPLIDTWHVLNAATQHYCYIIIHYCWMRGKKDISVGDESLPLFREFLLPSLIIPKDRGKQGRTFLPFCGQRLIFSIRSINHVEHTWKNMRKIVWKLM